MGVRGRGRERSDMEIAREILGYKPCRSQRCVIGSMELKKGFGYGCTRAGQGKK